MKKVSSSNGLEKCPKLRFSEFNDEWKQIKLSTIFQKNTKKNKDGLCTNVISNSAKNGLIPQSEYFDKDIANSENTNGYYIIKENDFVYNPRKSIETPYGPISRYTYKEDGIVSPLYLCFHSKSQIEPLYYEKYFKSSVWHRYIYMSGDSGARHDRVSIRDDIFFDMPIFAPNMVEQNMIASFLELIDQKIQKQQQLVELLKKYKIGLSNKIFNEYLSDCEYINFDNLFFTISDKPYQVNSNEYESEGLFEIVDQGKKLIVGYTDKKEKLFTEIPIIVFGDHTTILKYRCEPFVVGGDGVKLITTKTNNNLLYLFYALEHFNIKSEGYKRHYSILKEISLPIPTQQQQLKFAELLQTIDSRIIKESDTLNKYIMQKKGLLQGLFI